MSFVQVTPNMATLNQYLLKKTRHLTWSQANKPDRDFITAGLQSPRNYNSDKLPPHLIVICFSFHKERNQTNLESFSLFLMCVCVCVYVCGWLGGRREGGVTFAPASWIQRAHRMRPDCLHFSSNAILVRTNMKVSQLTIFLTSIALTTWWNITLKQSNSRPFISIDPFVALSLLKSSSPWIKTDQLYWFCVQQFVARHPSRLA